MSVKIKKGELKTRLFIQKLDNFYFPEANCNRA